jgi:hypothetical protein
LFNFLDFLANMKYSDKYLGITLIKTLMVIREYDVEGFGKDYASNKLHIYIKVNGFMKKILENPNISFTSKLAIESSFLMNNSFELSMIYLISKATENLIESASE